MKINQLLPQRAEKLTAEDFVYFAVVVLKKIGFTRSTLFSRGLILINKFKSFAQRNQKFSLHQRTEHLKCV